MGHRDHKMLLSDGRATYTHGDKGHAHVVHTGHDTVTIHDFVAVDFCRKLCVT